MFSVKRAIEKLIECSKNDTEHCNNHVSRAELMAILEAGHDNSVDEKGVDETMNGQNQFSRWVSKQIHGQNKMM